MSLVKLKPHLTLPHRIPEASGNSLLLYDASEKTIRPATQTDLESLIFSSTYWDDLQVSLTSSKLGANNKPDFDETNVGYLFPQNDTSEILYIQTQLPHRWKEGTTIYPHIHWRQSANQTPVFKIDYKVYAIGGAVPANFTTYTMSTLETTYTSGTIHQVSTNATGITMTGLGISTMFVGKLYRDDNVYTGDVLTDQFDIHYEIDSAGSDEEDVK